MMLESMTPLSYLGSQALVFFYPFVTAFLNSEDYKEFQQMLEYRESIQYMIQVIEREQDIRDGTVPPEPPPAEDVDKECT